MHQTMPSQVLANADRIGRHCLMIPTSDVQSSYQEIGIVSVGQMSLMNVEPVFVNIIIYEIATSSFSLALYISSWFSQASQNVMPF
jgi:hypothetical protein